MKLDSDYKPIAIFRISLTVVFIWGYAVLAAQNPAPGGRTSAIGQEESEKLKASALVRVKEYFSAISFLARASSDQKAIIADDLLAKNFENRNVLVINDFDPSGEKKSKIIITNYLKHFEEFSNASKVDIVLGKVNISPLYWSEEFVFVKAEVVRALSFTSPTGETKLDSMKLDLYLKFMSDKAPKIHRIKENQDTRNDFLPLQISDALKPNQSLADPMAAFMRFQLFPTTVLNVTSDPSQARISINERESRYYTPARLELSQGNNKISLRGGSYLAFDTILNLKGSKSLSFGKKLIPGWAELQVKTYPPEAQIYIDGQLAGLGEIRRGGPIDGFTPGLVRIEARSEKFRTLAREIDLKPGAREKLELNLMPTMGKLIVESTPAGAEVSINGQSVGKTPLSKELNAAQYSLVVTLDKYKTVREQVTILDLKDTRVSRDLISFASVSKSLRTKAGLAYTIGLTSLAAGAYLKYSAETSYKAYPAATNNAVSLREKVQFGDKYSPIAFAVGGVAMLTGFIFSGKISKMRRTWDLAASPVRDGVVVSFSRKF